MPITIRKPFDAHVHFRTGQMMRDVVPYSAAQFSHVLVMPNTEPPIITGDDVRAYREAIRACVDPRIDFQPLMTFKISPATTVGQVQDAMYAGALAGKLYPDGVTTNSVGGVRDFEALFPIFECMQELNVVLCLHGEHPDAECMDRERRFIDDVFHMIVERYPRLRVVLEHISTKEGIEAVRSWDADRVGGTITLHHLEVTHTEVFGGHLKPHLFCKPIPKWNKDREALREAVLNGERQFFFGSDSAPHSRDRKECTDGCAGVFTAPVLLPALAGLFEREGALDRFEPFVSHFATEFYGLLPSDGKVTLVEEEWVVPDECAGIVPYRAGETLAWRVAAAGQE
ncbi:MAG TPA: dihydroorotase [Verrucomicrobiae bacterium]|nr:dihydroorotase [Verrucomicrobiae bacterium]